MVFLILWVFIDWVTGEERDYCITLVDTMLRELERLLRRKGSKEVVNAELWGKC